jgi:putative flippase GtrA
MTRGRRFMVFNVVGALGVVVQLTTFALLTGVAHVHYMTATPVAVAAAVAHNFLWHRWWTWGGRRTQVRLALLRFTLTNGLVSLAGNLGVMATLVSGANVPLVPANVVAITLCGLLNFWLGETFVFSRAD